MFISIFFASCFLYILCSGQTAVSRPSLGTVYPSTDNSSSLNFTFIYPDPYPFDKLYIRFTIYDFSANQSYNPQPTPSLWGNFTNSNYSLPWISPMVMIQPGAYVIGCFEWQQTTNSEQLVADTNQCILTRAPVNSAILPAANPMTTFMSANASLTAMAYFPAELPYDIIAITSNLNGNTSPSWSNTTLQNSTYSKMGIFTFMNLNSNIGYNACVYYNYSNSVINGTQKMYTQCMSLNFNSAIRLSNKVISIFSAFIILLIHSFM